MNTFAKIFRGDNVRFSRFHTESGKFADLLNMPDFFLALFSWLRLKMTSRYVVKPWWVYSAIRNVEKHLRSTDRVLEVGGGYSTIWLATYCKEVYSIEEDQYWANTVLQHAACKNLSNIKQVIGDSRKLLMNALESKWDVVVIDGPKDRLAIFNDTLASVTKPRIIIYDDTDKCENIAALTTAVTGYTKKTFRGFKPQTVHVSETSVFYYSDESV